MQLTLEVSRLANKFFVINNLAEWHESCRIQYNEAWLRRTGALTPTEATALKKFKALISRYGFSYDQNEAQCHLGVPFYRSNETQAWSHIKKLAGKDGVAILKKVFAVFEPRFARIWKLYADTQRIASFRARIGTASYQQLLTQVVRLFGGRKESITVVILFAPVQGAAAGGANLGKRYCTLELPRIPNNGWEMSYSLGVLAHEIAHTYLNGPRWQSMITNALRAANVPQHLPRFSQQSRSLVNEAIVDSFLPLGHLGQEYLPHLAPLLLSNLHKISSTAYPNCHLEYYFVWRLYPRAAEYGKANKPINRQFIAEAVRALTEIL